MDRILSIELMDRIFPKPLASQPLKKTAAQLLVSVSVFSFVFSWPWQSPLTYYEKLSTQLLSKNCIFLICNGILVFVAKTSALVRSPSPSDVHDMLQNQIADGPQIRIEAQPDLHKHVVLEECGDVAADEDDGEFESCSNEAAEEVEESDDEDVENDEFGNGRVSEEEEEDEGVVNGEEDESDEIEKMSTEELNQKFEDFITRMKEEFRVNQPHQLVMVN